MKKQALIQVKNLCAGYNGDIVLDDISFAVHAGEIICILGGSGCGKSTLLRHMIGLEKALSGRILIDGRDITTCSEPEFGNILRKIGVLFQGSALIGSMTIGENVALPIAEHSHLPRDTICDLVRMKLSMVDLAGYEDHLPSEISGGMKKRAGLARALALTPKILFLDEPSAGLDPMTSAEIDELILHINRTTGTTMVIVTHELDSIFTIAKKVVMIDKNTRGIIAHGDPLLLKTNSKNPLVSRFFNRRPGPGRVMQEKNAHGIR